MARGIPRLFACLIQHSHEGVTSLVDPVTEACHQCPGVDVDAHVTGQEMPGKIGCKYLASVFWPGFAIAAIKVSSVPQAYESLPLTAYPGLPLGVLKAS